MTTPLSTLLQRGRQQTASALHSMSAAGLLSLSFIILIVAGTIGLKVLPGLYTGEGLSWIDALFTATSAVCVTGLIVVDTATHFTTAGQAFLLILIQLGGLGIITFTTLIISSLGLRISLRQHDIAISTAQFSPQIDHRRLTRSVVVFTLALELIGAVLLYLMWIPDLGWTGSIWPAIFHSVSAFCNAGFSVFSDSLMGYADRPAILGIVMTLVLLGGIGFLVLEELNQLRISAKRNQPFRLSLHSRLVLWSTGILLLGGWGLFTLFEWNVSFAGWAPVDRVVNGLFMSVTARTAGFNTIDYNTAANNSDFLTIMLMMIGGSPGSAAGGLKTTTFALIALMAWANVRGRSHVSFAHRSVPDETLQRSLSLFVIFFCVAALAIFVFTISELAWASRTDNAFFLPFLFEVVSALNTVGLSMGVTPDLSSFGRVLTIVLMFVGRVGPLTVAAIFATRARRSRFHVRDATEDVGVG